jgi:hypothetical protein
MLHEAGAFDQQVGVALSRQRPADGEAQNADDGKYPGFPPVPAPGDQQRQQGYDDNKKQHLDDNTGRN